MRSLLEDHLLVTVGHLVEQGRLLGYSFYWSGINDDVLDSLDRTGVLEIIGRESIFPVAAAAVEAIAPQAHRGSSEARCPLREAGRI